MILQNYDENKKIIAGVKITELKRHEDDGGYFHELVRLQGEKDGRIYPHRGSSSTFQINHSRLEKGAIKAFHVHKEQTDHWYVLDKALVMLIDVRPEIDSGNGVHDCKNLRERSMRIVTSKPMIITIPPGVAHGIGAIYEKTDMIYLVDRFFNPKDEWRLSWDLIGKEVWEITKG